MLNQIFALTFLEGKRKYARSMLVSILACSMKDTVCACGVKHAIERVKESGIVGQKNSFI